MHEPAQHVLFLMVPTEACFQVFDPIRIQSSEIEVVYVDNVVFKRARIFQFGSVLIRCWKRCGTYNFNLYSTYMNKLIFIEHIPGSFVHGPCLEKRE